MKSNWILPCNTAIFDVVSHFAKSKKLYWGATSSTQKGDTLYLYLCRPQSEIKYRCHVEAVDVDESLVEASAVAFLLKKKTRKRLITLVVDKEYPENLFPYAKLIEHGLISVQSQMRITDELANYISRTEEEKNA